MYVDSNNIPNSGLRVQANGSYGYGYGGAYGGPQDTAGFPQNITLSISENNIGTVTLNFDRPADSRLGYYKFKAADGTLIEAKASKKGKIAWQKVTPPKADDTKSLEDAYASAEAQVYQKAKDDMGRKSDYRVDFTYQGKKYGVHFRVSHVTTTQQNGVTRVEVYGKTSRY